MQDSTGHALRRSRAVLILAALIVALALVATTTGLFRGGGPGEHTVTSVRGEAVELYGEGIYRYDTVFAGAGNRGTDTITLALGLPTLLASSILYWRGSLRAGLVLIGTVSYFLYVYSSYSLGATAYNDLFLVYVALFAATLYALAWLFYDVNVSALGRHFQPGIPCRGPAWLMFIGGIVLLVVWGLPVVTSLINDDIPTYLDTYTTLVTYALDLAVLMPATFLAWWLLLRRRPLGYLIAVPLLGILVFLGPAIAMQTVFQLAAGVDFEPGEIIGAIGGFGAVAAAAIWFMFDIVRHVSDEPAADREPWT